MAATAPSTIPTADVAVETSDGRVLIHGHRTFESGEGTESAEVQSSRNGGPWQPLRHGLGVYINGSGDFYVYDYEQPHGARLSYRVRVARVDTQTGVYAYGPWSQPTTEVQMVLEDWWLKCPQMGTALPLFVDWKEIGYQLEVERTFVWAMSRPGPIVDQGVERADRLTLSVRILSKADFDLLRRIHRAPYECLLQNDRGEQWYGFLEGRLNATESPTSGEDPDYTAELNFQAV